MELSLELFLRKSRGELGGHADVAAIQAEQADGFVFSAGAEDRAEPPVKAEQVERVIHSAHRHALLAGGLQGVWSAGRERGPWDV